MFILAAIKSVLNSEPDVTKLLKGGIWISRVDQASARPNILLKLVGGGQDYTHSGNVGLFDAGVQVICRGDTDATTATLGDAVVKTLENWTGTAQNCRVQLIEHMDSIADYDEPSKVFTHTSEYTVFYSRVT